MKICHISDTHSLMNKLNGDFDAIVHSGDFMPNSPFRFTSSFQLNGYIDVPREYHFQKKWITDNLQRLADWIGDKPFIFCAGNHDFYDPIPLMKDYGINAINITNASYTYNGLKFYGFPYVPFIGCWNFELGHDKMTEEVERVVALSNEGEIDILVCHCPPANILDYDHKQGKHFGNGPLKTSLEYKFDILPKALLTGHIHQSHGTYVYNNMIISNAATIQRIIEIT